MYNPLLPDLSDKPTDDLVTEMNNLYTKLRVVANNPNLANQLLQVIEMYKEEYRKRLLEDPKENKKRKNNE